MKRILVVLVLTLAFHLSACNAIWAQALSGRMSEDLMAIESYRGRLVEHRLIPGAPEIDVRKELLYERPWKLRAEVVEPAAHAGELFITDGQSLTLWWPQALFGIRVRGFAPPSQEQVRAHLEREARAALKAYAYSLDGRYPWAGQKSNRWQAIPVRKAPYRYRYTAWMHERYSFPLKLDVYDSPDTLWYGMEFEKITFGVPVPADAFAFTFPPNAVVFEWDLADPGISLEEARRTMNFDVLLPSKLPEGHSVRKIVAGRHCLPMIAVLMDRGGTWISLTEVRHLGEQFELPMGKKIPLAGAAGYLNFAGSYSLLSWAQGTTQLTLIGNVAYPELIAIAQSVK